MFNAFYSTVSLVRVVTTIDVRHGLTGHSCFYWRNAIDDKTMTCVRWQRHTTPYNVFVYCYTWIFIRSISAADTIRRSRPCVVVNNVCAVWAALCPHQDTALVADSGKFSMFGWMGSTGQTVLSRMHVLQVSVFFCVYMCVGFDKNQLSKRHISYFSNKQNNVHLRCHEFTLCKFTLCERTQCFRAYRVGSLGLYFSLLDLKPSSKCLAVFYWLTMFLCILQTFVMHSRSCAE